MGKIVVSENASLDGVVQDPTGEEGFLVGGWFRQISDADREAWPKIGLDEALSAEACRWACERRVVRLAVASGTGEWADRLNSMPRRRVGDPRPPGRATRRYSRATW